MSGRFSAVVSGAFFTAVIQSSTAAILTVIGFVNAGLVTFSQAVGMIIGATLGTTSTIWLVAIFGLRFRISAAALPEPPAGFEAGAQALARWLDTTKDPQAAPDPAIFKAVEDASKQLSAERKANREKMLDDVALQRMPTATARAALEILVWADLALYHSWRLAESLRIASGR